MVVSRNFLVILALCLVHQSLGRPTTADDVNEGRGFFSTIWDWITYPFTWWGSEEPEQPTTTHNPNEVVEVANPNTTITCNDQTCTNINCNETECKNVTCNIYDTDVNGKCKEYNLLPDLLEKDPDFIPTELVQKVPLENETKAPQESSEKPSNDKPADEKDTTFVKEQPLELEAILSSTVNNQDNKLNKEETITESKI